jgi:hypothetical protein
MFVSFAYVRVNGSDLNFEVEFGALKVCRIKSDIGGELSEMAVNF